MKNKFPPKYQLIWSKSKKFLEQGRPGDVEHAKQVADFILNYKGKLKLDKDVLVPLAIMHDIGHATILPEHFEYITGPKKVVNGKLVHMLAGAKIAKDILAKCNYPKKKATEIVELIAMHDADQLKDVKLEEVYNTPTKKIFHDIDALDRFSEERMRKLAKLYNDPAFIKKALNDTLDNFFYNEFKQVAQVEIKTLFKQLFGE